MIVNGDPIGWARDACPSVQIFCTGPAVVPPQKMLLASIVSGVTIVQAQSNGLLAPAQLPLESGTSDVPLSIRR